MFVLTSDDYREELRQISGHDTLIFLMEAFFDSAVVGVTLEGRVVYDTDACIAALIHVDGMTEEDASEHFDFNVAGSYIDGGPIFMSVATIGSPN